MAEEEKEVQGSSESVDVAMSELFQQIQVQDIQITSLYKLIIKRGWSTEEEMNEISSEVIKEALGEAMAKQENEEGESDGAE